MIVDAPLSGARRWLIVAGAGVGLMFGFAGLYYSTLAFFLLPIATDFGWTRAHASAVSVMSMLGMSVGAPLVGSLFKRLGTERVIGASVLLFSGGLFVLSRLPPNPWAFGVLSFSLGLLGSATTVIGYLSVVPQWFDRKLGLALGLAGLGLGLGVALGPLLSTRLIAHFGWRGAYAAMAMVALAAGAVAWGLISPRMTGSASLDSPASVSSQGEAGLRVSEALVDWRFWLIAAVIFLSAFALLGSVIHAASIFSDRGLMPQQAALAAALGGLGTLGARVLAGPLLDRVFAPFLACGVLLIAAIGIAINSQASSFPWLVLGSAFSGVAIGTEGDLIPFLVRRYFGMRAFGAVFGTLFSAYTLGGLLGPVTYGYVFDRLNGYAPIMIGASLACAAGAVGILFLGPYRFRAAQSPRANEVPGLYELPST